MPEEAFIIADPEAVRVLRMTDDGKDWIVQTYEFTLDGETYEGKIALTPDDFMAVVTGGLLAFGFPEADTDYLLDRFAKEYR